MNKQSVVWQLVWKVAVLCLLTAVIGCFFTKPLPWILGVVLGFAFTVCRLIWLDSTIRTAVEKEAKDASRYMRGQYVLRYLLSIAVLVLAALVPQISLFSTMIAMFTLKIATYIQGFLEKKTPKDGSVQFEEWVDEEEQEKEEDWNRWQTYNMKARKRAEKEKGRIQKVSQQMVEQVAEEPETSAEDEVMEDQISLFDE